MSAGLLASTMTPGSTPPVASLTEPAITLCAAAHPGMSSRSAQPIATTKAILLIMRSHRSSAQDSTPALTRRRRRSGRRRSRGDALRETTEETVHRHLRDAVDQSLAAARDEA